MNTWRRWVELLGRQEAATSLAITRILVGLAVAGHLTHMLGTGAWRLVWTRPEDGGLRDLDPGWLAWIGGNTAPNILALTIVTALACLGFALGAFTRPMLVIAWIGFRTLADLNNHSGGSYDELLKNEIFILLLSGCGRALSIDALRGKGGPVPAWARYVLLAQLVIMYQATGLQKISAGWVPGGNLDALWYIFQQPTWQRWEMYWLAPYFPVTQLATLGTWIFEVGSPVLFLFLFYRDTRTRPGRLRAFCNRVDARALFLLWGFLMHIGIEVSMEVGMFSFGSLALYSCFFHPDELAAFARRLRGAR